MPNRLQHESSPYLLQHAHNPVEWYPWGPEALQRARDEDKPIFLSVGYSACHWCHVMERESFENESLAAVMNQAFVCIKVDREERPDLDQIYMNAVQLLTGRGGWPMSVFLPPNLQPFFGGTYWPPTPKMGMPGFGQVLEAVAEAWQERREKAHETAAELTAHLQQIGKSEGDPVAIDRSLVHQAARKIERAADRRFGGFGQAPKFPQPMNLRLLLREWHSSHNTNTLDLVRLNLDKMARGGIYDHLGGGFARYSVDQRWLVPHFEKMLYDNALLTVAYVEGFQATSDPFYARVARETCDYVLRDMTDEQGGFHSTEDADSEGEEGKFYVWTPQEIKAILGEKRGERFCKVYDVTEGGNFEGKNILNLSRPIQAEAELHQWNVDELRQELSESRDALRQVRETRVRPAKDDKILTSWNGLMIEAVAFAGAVLEEARYLAAARSAAHFVLNELRRDDGRLLHCWRRGKAKFDAYLDDYVYLIQALTVLYEADFDERWIDEAVQLADLVLAHFHDTAGGGFYFTADDHESLIARNKDVHDSSVPSGNGMAATALQRLGRLCGRDDFEQAAESTLTAAGHLMEQAPSAAGQLLLAADFSLGPTRELVFLSHPGDAAFAKAVFEVRQRFLPNKVIAARTDPDAFHSAHLASLFEGKEPVDQLTLFACERFVCREPVRGIEGVRSALRDAV